MFPPHALLAVLLLVVTRVLSDTHDVPCTDSSAVYTSETTSCQKVDVAEHVQRWQSRLSDLLSPIGSDPAEISSKQRIFKRQARRTRRDECENAQLSQIMQHVLSPLLSMTRMRLGDIAKILQQSVQRATGRSFEITMGKADMVVASHQMSDSSSCSLQVGDYYATVRETPIQYDINNLEQEKILSNIDFGEKLGGSGYPGQPAFPQALQPPSEQTHAANSANSAQSSSAQSSSAQSSSAQSNSAQSNSAQSNSAQSNSAQSNSAQSNSAQSNSAQLVQPNLAQSSLAQSSLAQSSLAQSSLAQSALAQNSLAQLALAEPYYAGGQGNGQGGAAGAGAGACFSGDLIVETTEGPKQMSDLKTGDEVLSVEQTMVSFFPIVMFLHRDEQLLAEFNVITTTNGYSVKLTNEHLIYVFDCDLDNTHRLVRAMEVNTEHCLIIARSPRRTLSIDRVANITKTYERGIYAPLTSTGDIIVNDILSSCHSTLAVRSLQDSFFKVYRFLFFMLPERGELPFGLALFASALDLFIPVKAI